MTPDDWLMLSIMSVLLVASGCISGSETALFSLEPTRVSTFAQHRDPLRRLIARLLERQGPLLLTILLLNNAINIAFFALGSAWSGRHADHPTTAGIIGLGSLTSLIVVGEILPKVIASGRAETWARLASPGLWMLVTVTTPLRWLFERPLRNLVKDADDGPGEGAVNADELKLVIEDSHEHGVVSELAHDRLIEIVDLSLTPVAGVMTHRVDCLQVPVDASHDDAVEILRTSPMPYLLVVDDQEDCVGLLTAQDLLRGGRPAKRMRKPLFIPGGAQLSQVLELFQQHGRIAGVVVDEYGGTAGLITMAHIGNELLGEATSEDLPDLPKPERLTPTKWRLHGGTALEAWNALIDAEDREGCTTIAGFVTRQLGTVPHSDDRLLYRNLLFVVETVERRRIEFLTVEELPAAQARRITRELGGRR